MPDTVYEQVETMQQAINKAAETGKVVRFLSSKSRKELLREVVDKRDCKLMKKDKESNDIAVIPPGIENFDFDLVDTAVTPTSTIWLPPYLRG